VLLGVGLRQHDAPAVRRVLDFAAKGRAQLAQQALQPAQATVTVAKSVRSCSHISPRWRAAGASNVHPEPSAAPRRQRLDAGAGRAGAGAVPGVPGQPGAGAALPGHSGEGVDAPGHGRLGGAEDLLLYTIMVTGCIWEKVVFGCWLFAPAFFWEDVFSMLVLALHTAYLVALYHRRAGRRGQMCWRWRPMPPT
jgi:hypothetical protein